MDRETYVRKALSDFLQQHKLHDSVSCVDEIVLTYLLSILDDLGDTSNTEENLDAEYFSDMMVAYVPGFDKISSVEVWEWMFSLSGKLTEDGKVASAAASASSTPSIEQSNGCSPSMGGDCSLIGATSMAEIKEACKRRERNSHSEGEIVKHSQDIGRICEFDSQVDMLCEMFPDTCVLEVRHCLSSSNGNTDEAVQLILFRQETGNSIQGQNIETHPVKRRVSMLADKELKELTLARYSFVDTDDDKKTHRPPPIKKESKKMIRYLDGRVVSTKGEKFTEIKKAESEEMKKTYVSLKPARKYRFH